jgi:hypothetical protein
MKKRAVVSLLTLILFVAVFTVYAGLSFVGGGSVTLGSVHGTVDIAGFGNDTQSVTVTMNVTGSNLTAWCTNRGGNQAPGQNPVNVNASVTSSEVFPAHNGRATVNLSVNILPTWDVAGCPNRNWRVTDLIGTIFVTFTGVDTSTEPDTTVTLALVCNINEPNQTIICSPLP